MEQTRLYWPIALAGYAIQMAAVPLLALAGNWWAAAALIMLERIGKAVRNPAANTMMSRAGEKIGQGWAFGLHEALDQTGALAGPLIAALVLAHHHEYRTAFLWLGMPAGLTMVAVVTVALRFPYASRVQTAPKNISGDGLSRAFWLYTASAALFAFGFADYSLIAYHYSKAAIVSAALIPVLYAVAMGMSGAGSLVFGRWFDKRGLAVLYPGIDIGRCGTGLDVPRRIRVCGRRHDSVGAWRSGCKMPSCRRPSRIWSPNMREPEPMAYSRRSMAWRGSWAARFSASSTMFRWWRSPPSRRWRNSPPLFH